MDAGQVTWVEAGDVETGQCQHSLSGPRRVIAVSRGWGDMTLAYDDGTERTYDRHELVPILVGEEG